MVSGITQVQSITAVAASQGSGSGNVSGPGSSTDNAVVKWDGTGGTQVSNTGVVINDDNSVIITSSVTAAFVVGPNGATNPCLSINAATASQATGIQITGRAAGSGATISSGFSGNENLSLASIGSTGRVILQPNGSTRLNCGLTDTSFTAGAASSGATTQFLFTGGASTAQTATTNTIGFYINLGQTVQHSTGAITLLTDVKIDPRTHSFVGASTVTDAASLYVTSAPSAGTNATITNSWALYLAAGNSYSSGKFVFDATNTTGGTTGAQTINKPSGSVNFAAAATSLVVTNSLVNANSIIFATVMTNDTTMKSVQCVPTSGAFTLYANAAATAETRVGFVVIN